MPTNHALYTSLPPSGDIDRDLLRGSLVKRAPYALAAPDNPQDLVATDPVTGDVIIDILYLGRVFHFDPADTTSVHDGTTVLVTSDSKVYKLAAGSELVAYSVLDRTATPPGSPSIGDAYLTLASSTGAWSGHDLEIAIYTARGWEFITPAIGRMIYVEDEDAYYRKKQDGTLAIGFGANALAAASVLPSHMLGGGGRVLWQIENQTTNTPPAVSNGVAYIIGSSPTGAWSGHAGKIAHGEAGAWVIYAPAEGWIAYDKNLNAIIKYTGAAWEQQSGRFRILVTGFTASGTFSKNSRCIGVLVYVKGGGGGSRGTGGGAGNGGTGGTSSFGSHCSATGGTGGTNVAGGTGGSGSGGNFNESGQPGQFITATITALALAGGSAPGAGARGSGGATGAATAGSGGGGGRAIEWVSNDSLAGSETVTVGAGGNAGAGSDSSAGTGGEVVVYEFIED